MISNKSYHTADDSLRPPLPEHIIPIVDINDMLLLRTTFLVEGIVTISNFAPPFWYTSCDRCHKVVSTKIYTLFECLFCNSSQAKAIPWEGSSKLKRLTPTSQIAESNPQALVMSVTPLSQGNFFLRFRSVYSKREEAMTKLKWAQHKGKNMVRLMHIEGAN